MGIKEFNERWLVNGIEEDYKSWLPRGVVSRQKSITYFHRVTNGNRQEFICSR